MFFLNDIMLSAFDGRIVFIVESKPELKKSCTHLSDVVTPLVLLLSDFVDFRYRDFCRFILL